MFFQNLRLNCNFMSTIKVFLIISLFFLAGCTLFGRPSGYQAYNDSSTGSQLPKHTMSFNEDFEHVWATVIMSLEDLPIDKINKGKGTIKTGWAEGFSQTRKARSLVTDRFLNDYWKERYRLTITISGSILSSSVKPVTSPVMALLFSNRSSIFL